MNQILSIKKFYLLIFVLSIFVILSAIYIEYIVGAKACVLCIYQRFPFIAAIFFSYFGYNNSKKYIWIYLIIVTFFISFILSGYHVGIENNIFPEYKECSVENLNVSDKDQLLNSLSETPPNCKDVNFRIFSLSLATINVLISLIVVIISILLLKYEKNR